MAQRARASLPDGIAIRPWRVADAEALAAAVTESIEHLRPWMPWIANEPMSLEARRGLMADWEVHRTSGGDRLFGVFLADRAIGACGLHRRVGAGALEIGYWVHVDYVGRGIATAAAAHMIDEAFREPGIERAEIQHDVANLASEAIPRKLGFELIAERSVDIKAPAETGSRRVWVVTRSSWRR